MSIGNNQSLVDNVITVHDEILSGTPVFKNTRVPIKNLIDYLEAGDSIDRFLEDFPSVKSEQISSILKLTKQLLFAEVYANSNRRMSA